MSSSRLLLDATLPRRLARRLADIFPGTEHISLSGLLQADDLFVWEYASSSKFCLVTTQADFYELATTPESVLTPVHESDAEAPPPEPIVKFLLLRGCGYPAAEAESVLRAQSNRITAFLDDPELAVLVLANEPKPQT